jgi:hypothetical protein
MPSHTTHKAEAFMTQVEDKIRVLLREYSEGKLNSEQFHVLYERYSSQRLIAQQAMLTGDEQVLHNNTPGEKSTIAIKDEHMGKAIGLRIYHNKNGAVIETLGDFDVSAFVISPVLAEFRHMIANDKLIRPRAEKIEDKRWLLFAAEPQTAVVTLFRNEPSPMQIREIQRLHHDFEVANQSLLRQGQPDSKSLAYPFHVFVQRKLKK